MFLIILQNYTIVLKFIRFNNPTAVEGPTVVAHGGWPYYRWRRRLQEQSA
jgi:hypothetical protein